jgi:hypothetical protein
MQILIRLQVKSTAQRCQKVVDTHVKKPSVPFFLFIAEDSVFGSNHNRNTDSSIFILFKAIEHQMPL